MINQILKKGGLLICLLLMTISVVYAVEVTAVRIWQKSATPEGFPGFLQEVKEIERTKQVTFTEGDKLITTAVLGMMTGMAISDGYISSNSSKDELAKYVRALAFEHGLVNGNGEIIPFISGEQFISIGQGPGWRLLTANHPRLQATAKPAAETSRVSEVLLPADGVTAFGRIPLWYETAASKDKTRGFFGYLDKRGLLNRRGNISPANLAGEACTTAVARKFFDERGMSACVESFVVAHRLNQPLSEKDFRQHGEKNGWWLEVPVSTAVDLSRAVEEFRAIVASNRVDKGQLIAEIKREIAPMLGGGDIEVLSQELRGFESRLEKVEKGLQTMQIDFDQFQVGVDAMDQRIDTLAETLEGVDRQIAGIRSEAKEASDMAGGNTDKLAKPEDLVKQGVYNLLSGVWALPKVWYQSLSAKWWTLASVLLVWFLLRLHGKRLISKVTTGNGEVLPFPSVSDSSASKVDRQAKVG